MQRFLVDFGFAETAVPGRYRVQGEGPAWAVEIVEGRKDAFIGFSFSTPFADDVRKLATETGRPIHEVGDEPGSIGRVSLFDPDGFPVDLLHVAEPGPALAALAPHSEVNGPGRAVRVNSPIRPALAPAVVHRLGHIVLQCNDFAASARWYMRHFGLIASDLQLLGDGSPGLGFFRLDRGAEPADHHTVALLAGPGPAMLHLATETSDLDALGQGHQFLKAGGWTHHWGVGRHELGSQLFDYWLDPAGAEWEHYADGDLMDASHPTGIHRLSRAGLWTWGDDLPDSMRPRLTLGMIWTLLRASPEKRRQLGALKDALASAPREWLR
jgi:catechol 2,3-dioxygenase-like lactoylglutathione lyase family enzyme